MLNFAARGLCLMKASSSSSLARPSGSFCVFVYSSKETLDFYPSRIGEKSMHTRSRRLFDHVAVRRRSSLMTSNKPPAGVVVNSELVESLVGDVAPELVGESLKFHASGWDSEMYRIGDCHAARLPRHEAAAPLILNEPKWLPKLADRLPLPIPSPTHAGKPGFGFPFHLSIVPWLHGVLLLYAPPVPAELLMEQLASFINALHITAPADAPKNPYRGVPLIDRSESVRQLVVTCARVFESLGISGDEVQGSWKSVVETPTYEGDPTWVHGELHLANILVRGGQLSAVIDIGDLCSGDPAVDLSVAWMFFDDEAHRLKFRELLVIDGKNVDGDTWKRARGNALAHALAVLAHSDDESGMRRMGARTLLNTIL